MVLWHILPCAKIYLFQRLGCFHILSGHSQLGLGFYWFFFQYYWTSVFDFFSVFGNMYRKFGIEHFRNSIQLNFGIFRYLWYFRILISTITVRVWLDLLSKSVWQQFKLFSFSDIFFIISTWKKKKLDHFVSFINCG